MYRDADSLEFSPLAEVVPEIPLRPGHSLPDTLGEGKRSLITVFWGGVRQ